MPREIITINVGGAGVNIGTAITEQYMTEHGISTDGTREDEEDSTDSPKTFFEESEIGQFRPRQVSVDLDPSGLDTVRSSRFASCFHPQFLLSGKEDAAGCFARGYKTVGKAMIDQVNDRIRKLCESSENVQGFVVNHSLGGGTGSGLGSVILERLAVDDRKKCRFGFEVLSGDLQGNRKPCEAYNQCLAYHSLLDTTSVSVFFDNKKLGQICKTQLGVGKPSYAHVNALIAKVASGLTGNMRLQSDSHEDLNTISSSLVPFPRLHFMTTSFAGLGARKQTVRELSVGACQAANMALAYPHFDPMVDKYLAVSLNYRGPAATSKEANASASYLKTSQQAVFAGIVQLGIQLGINAAPVATVEDSCVGAQETSCTMVGNNVAIRRNAFAMRRFDLMYSKKAYVHQYAAEGLQEGEFAQAREDVRSLEKDYLDVLAKG